MKFSKKAFLTAAFLLGGLSALPAAETITVNATTKADLTTNFAENYYVTNTGVLNIECTNTFTMFGKFLGSNAATVPGGQIAAGADFERSYSMYAINAAGGEISISGGGYFEYNGFSDIDYYSSTYRISNGAPLSEIPDSLLQLDANTGWVDPTESAFSGQVTVSGGTTLAISGYLCQQVGYFTPQVNPTATANDGVNPAHLINVGASNIVLKDTSVITFKSAPKNLLSTDFEYGDESNGAMAGSVPVRSLNFLTNVKADINTTIEIGTDVASTSRIIITTQQRYVANLPAEFENAPEGWDGVGTIGKLTGTGRVYLAGEGQLSILNRAEFSTGVNTDGNTPIVAPATTGNAILDYVNTLGATYNLAGDRDSGQALADVYFLGGTTRVGSDATHANVVNNVLETATAIQLNSSYTSGSVGYIAGTAWEGRPVYGGFSTSTTTGSASVSNLEINGTQVLNNLQSLFVERASLITEYEEGGEGFYELTPMFNNDNYALYTGRGATISLQEGSTLIINQLEGRDGVYFGKISASNAPLAGTNILNDAYIVKTGAGTFVNVQESINNVLPMLINRLYILEGRWVGTATSLGSSDSRVILGTGGELLMLSNNTSILRARIEGVSSFVIARDTSYTMEIDGVETLVGGIQNDGRWFMASESNLYSSRTGNVADSHDLVARGTVIVWQEQADFAGVVKVQEGMTLSLGYDVQTLQGTAAQNALDYELGSVFSNAAQISLEGAAGETSTLLINSYQIVNNLTGGQNSAVSLSDHATLVMNVQSAAGIYTGSISGTGGIVKLGLLGLTLSGGNYTNYTGSTVSLVGSINLGQDNAVLASSGVVLGNAGVTIGNSRSNGQQRFAALIGDEGTTVRMGAGALTVGLSVSELNVLKNEIASDYAKLDPARYPNYVINNTYFFATYAGAEKYFGTSGLNLFTTAGINNDQELVKTLNRLGSIRPVYKTAAGAALTEITVADTINDLKDPGQFRNAFAHLYTTMDSGVFNTVSATAEWQACFGTSYTNISSFLLKVFDKTTVENFATQERANVNSTWTERQLTDLLQFSENYFLGIVTLLDSEGNLTRSAYSYLKDIYAIKFLQDNYMTGTFTTAQLEHLDTYYGFLTLFDPDYEFVLTRANMNYLADRYGFDTGSWTDANKEEAFTQAIGVIYSTDDYGPGFAGTIDGEGASLRKIGYESLTLTGVNTYTGVTSVEAGELRVDWDSISTSSEVNVAEGALFTIVSQNDVDADGNLIDNIFQLGADGTGTLYGAGTLLKDGDGKLTIASALANTETFTGAIIVGKDQLTVNVGTRKNFASDIYLGTGTTFELAFQNIGTETDPAGTTLSFTGSINGSGTLVKSGLGTLVIENGNDIAGIAGNTFGLDVASGEVIVKLSGTNGTFRDQYFESELGNNATFTFDIEDGIQWSFAGLLATNAPSATGSGTTFKKTGAGTLLLNRPSTSTTAWNVENLDVQGGTLSIAAGMKSYDFTKVNTAAGTELAVNGTLGISGNLTDDENLSTIAGTLRGTGTIAKTGVGTLVISGENRFAGTLVLDAGTVELNVGTDISTGFKISTTVAGTAGTLVKSGAGSMTLSNSDVGGIATGLAIDVQGGKLSVNGNAFSSANSLAIAKGSIFEIAPTSGSMDLGTAIETISGAGTLALGTGTTTLSNNSNMAGFTGTIALTNADSVLELAGTIESFSGISGMGELKIGSSPFTFSQSENGTFTGKITGTAGTLVVIGDGRLNLSDGTTNATLAGISIQLGNETNAGNIGLGLDQGMNVKVYGNGNSIALVDSINSTSSNYNGTVDDADVERLSLQAQGTIDLGSKNVAQLFGLSSGAGTLTLSNYGESGNDLTVTLADAGAEINSNVLLGTSAGSALAISVPEHLDAVEPENIVEFSQNIGGNGDFKKVGTGTLHLTSAAQSYTGETTVVAGTLALNAGTELKTSKLSVASGATLSGGAALTADGSNIEFAANSTYEVDLSKGEHLTFNGTATGTFDLNVSNSTMQRGVAFKLVEYTGTTPAVAGTTNTLTINSLTGDIVFIDKNSIAQGSLVVYAAQNHLADVAGVDYHDGLGSVLDVLSVWARPDEHGNLMAGEKGALGEAINKTSNAALGDAISNLSALSYASMVSMTRSSFLSDVRSVSNRLEQRLYDNASPYAIWEYQADWEFFAQAQGSSVNSSDKTDSMVYDYNTFGAFAGMDRKLNHETTFGFAIGYDHGKASIHNSGGKIESDNARATLFVGQMVSESISLNFGAQVGYTSYDVSRNTLVGRNTGDTDGWNTGLFFDAVGAIPLWDNPEGDRLDLMPHVGFSTSYYGVGSFSEKGSVSALDTNSFDAFSLEGRIGATLNWSFGIGESVARASLDVSASHEFIDDEIDIDSSMLGEKMSVSARGISSTSLSLAPGFSVDFDGYTSVYVNYEFRVGTESEISHSANIGIRRRF